MKTPRKPLGIGLLIVALALFVAFGYYRRSDANAPIWLYAVAAVALPACIWYDIKIRKRGE